MAEHVRKVLAGEYELPYRRPNPVILDIGANIGSFALWASRRWPASVIHCYEPLPDNFAMLEKNLGALGNRVQLNPFAIGNPSRTRLYLGKNNCGEASFFDLGEQSEDWVNVQTKPADILPRADLLKLDTEGAEIEILSGMPKIDFDVILLEYHSESNRRQVDRMLEEYVLVGGEIRCRDRGVLKYMHTRLLAPQPPGANRQGNAA